jgi:DNA repair exonuclease SbcCD nuclease subunit
VISITKKNTEKRRRYPMKILHLSDIHARDTDIDEVEKCLGHIVRVAKQERPDLIINSGDTFDSQDVKLDSKAAKLIFRMFSDLADIAPVVGIIGTPTHDGNAAEVLHHIRAEYPVHIATRPQQIYLHSDGEIMDEVVNGYQLEAVISLIPAPTKKFFQTNSDIKGSDAEIAQAMNGLFAGFGAKYQELVEMYGEMPHILVGHWNVTGSLISETQTLTGVDIEISKDQMALANADLVCLGHIHMHQLIGANIFFAGSIFRNNYGEMDEKGFYIHEITELSETARSLTPNFIKTPTRKLAKIESDLTVEGSLDEMDIVLYGFEPEEIKDSVLRVTYKIYQDEAAKVDKKEVEDFYLSAGAKSVQVNFIRVPRENVRSQALLKLDTLREKLIENASLKNETVPESILIKADMLESMTHDDIIAENMIMEGGVPNEKSTIAA